PGLVLTNERLFAFEARFLQSELRIFWLEKVAMAGVRHVVLWLPLLSGITAALGSLALLAAGFFDRGGISRQENQAMVAGGAALLVFGLVLILHSRWKGFVVSTGMDKARVTLRGIRKEESQRFLESLSGALARTERSSRG
ncbi:MAG: hypothetical protein HY721_18770, partial [Planctomycetes bacterium]|nr:hypothetical protein [Planctomycetota bacterium]